MASNGLAFCDICEGADGDTSIRVVGFCAQCKELYCLQCLKAHMAMGMTRDHPVVGFEPLGFDTPESFCNICFSLGEGKRPAITLCINCRELYCDACKKRHNKFGATKKHDCQDIVRNPAYLETDDSVNLSSDFERCIVSAEKETSASSSYIRNQQKLSKSVLLPSSKEQHNLKHELPDSKTHQARAPVQKVRTPEENDMDKISITKVTLVDCKIDGDTRECWFESIVCMKDGRTLLLDIANKKLKLLDENLRILSIEPMQLKEEWPYRMTKISDEQVALCIGKSVYFYILKEDRLFLHKSGSVSVYGEPVSYTSGKYATRINNHIKIYSTSGKELHRIDIGDRGNLMFLLSQEGGRLYAFSGGELGIVECLSLQGKLLWEIGSVPYPGCVVERNGFLFIGSVLGMIILCDATHGTHQRTIMEDIEKLYGMIEMTYNDVTCEPSYWH